MSRYSKIDRRIHADAAFRELSSPQPCGKYLWFYLLTTPKLTAIPGAISATEGAICDALQWSVEGFREAFAELSQMGMAEADWRAGFIWLPNGVKYNRPENPNVVKSWGVPWDELPECILKVQAWQRLKDFTKDIGDSFGKAFIESCPKPSEKGLRKGMANPEPEQEQEQKQDKSLIKPTASEIEREGAGRELLRVPAAPEQPSQRRRPPAPVQATLIPAAQPTLPEPKRKKAETALPADFGISDRVQAWAAEKGYDRLEQRLEYFTGYAKAKAVRYADWDQAFMNSIRDDWAKFSGKPIPNGSSGTPKVPARRPKSLEEQLAEDGM